MFLSLRKKMLSFWNNRPAQLRQVPIKPNNVCKKNISVVEDWKRNLHFWRKKKHKTICPSRLLYNVFRFIQRAVCVLFSCVKNQLFSFVFTLFVFLETKTKQKNNSCFLCVFFFFSSFSKYHPFLLSIVFRTINSFSERCGIFSLCVRVCVKSLTRTGWTQMQTFQTAQMEGIYGGFQYNCIQ